MGAFGRDYHQRKLRRTIALAEDESYLKMIWGVAAAWGLNPKAAQPLFDFPYQHMVASRTSANIPHQWELEFLANELLITPKAMAPKTGPQKTLNCRSYEAIRRLTNGVRAFENAEYGARSSKFNVLIEMQRIAQRTFEWQRGVLNRIQMYRYADVLMGPKCASAFLTKHGLEMQEFSFFGFALYAQMLETPSIPKDLRFEGIKIDRGKFNIALELISLPIANARAHAKNLRTKPWGETYQPSVFRQFPLVGFGRSSDVLVCPLIDLLFLRVTSGLYYDVIGVNAEIRNEIGLRFEAYCKRLLERMLPESEVSGSHTYSRHSRTVDSPDIIVRRAEQPSIIVECKSKKMRIEDRFSEEPIADSTSSLAEIAKGIFQIWRYCAHIRENGYASKPYGLVLTLDTWYLISPESRRAVLAQAHEFADQDSAITSEDRIEVAVSPIQNVEMTLMNVGEIGFYQALAAVVQPRHYGWFLESAAEDLGLASKDLPYPFADEIGGVLPWWKELEERSSVFSARP